MELIIIRHGRAEEREVFAESGRPDGERPLTDEGRQRLRAALPGLKREQPTLDAILASPLTRARQTADEIAAGYPDARRLEVHELVPGSPPRRLAERLSREGLVGGAIALVGHEPDLGDLVSWLLCGSVPGFAPMKKGAACALDVSPPIHPGCATLRWSLSAAQLRRIGGG
ncbi:SixA phosphatase family protein [Endothiovibrio diazotrophicus]